MTTESTRSPRRRTVVALAVVLAVLSGFVVRLVDIQVVNADDHIADSMDIAFGATQTLYGTRGDIVDENGDVLAGSILLYDCQLDPLLITQIDELILAGESDADPWSKVSGEVAEITGQTVEEVQAIVGDALAEDSESRFAYLAKGVTTAQYRALADLDTSYIACLQHPARAYPDGAVAGNIVGYVGAEGAQEGYEQSQNSCLAATDGTRTFQKGKDGVVIPGTERETAAVDGGTLQLTINRDLQWYLQQLIGEQVEDMGAQAGSVLVYEVATGKVRAAAEYPTLDPNDVDATDPDDRASRLFRESWEPGSTFKALTAATVIDAGGQTPLSTVVASSEEFFADGARVRDAFQHPAYEYTLAGVLQDSSNAGISKFSQKVSNQVRYDYFKKFGIGDGTDSGYPGEVTGLVWPADEWGAQTALNTSYGQGLTATMPELARAYGAIANDGVMMPLSLIESCTLADGTVVEPELAEPTRVIKESTAADVQSMLENVFLNASYAKTVAIPGYRVAGKTGTAEKPDLVNGGYKAGVYYTTMIGFAPADDPQYVVVVNLDEPTKVTSSAANATAFQRAMTQVLKTYRVMPATSAPELLPKFG
ncbi:cell division protein FtsI (penicillin-binding protein 3) [Microbacterium terrae]|uniref:Penicillin-binding protein PbpB n=1 Tax=Microbacterium terrae TaxID=69369 RepID=A0A0M2HB32_9MICO|nr:penicillin-binding protein 2 [Microbacterium terrae]KJL41363.1 Penicillin-binding protein PbpB [Microbacterium terrae]MBP1077598.1 cell division protein FtsI (penicillin-binding protein 3) [Microbacterium terrae]GLJ99203.1 cell division protein FtsI [Microbacterium terrae]